MLNTLDLNIGADNARNSHRIGLLALAIGRVCPIIVRAAIDHVFTQVHRIVRPILT